MKRFKVLLFVVIVFILSILLENQIYAADTMDLNITDKRPYTEKKYTVQTQNGTEHTVFKIVKKDGGTYVHRDA